MIIGIDPGLTGGYCLLNKHGEIEYINNSNVKDGWIDYQKTVNKYLKLCEKYNELKTIKTYIEKPFVLSSQRGNEKIWRNYQTLVLAFNYPVEIRAQEWKKELGIPRGLSKKESIEWQFKNICPVYNEKHNLINWNKTTKKGKVSSQLNDGLIDAYCIAKYAYTISQK